MSDIRAQEGGGAMLLALAPGGHFVTNPPVSTCFAVGDVLIVVGTASQVDDLHTPGAPVSRLVVLRHAKSAYPPGVVDRDRPLNPRGVVDAKAAGV